MAISDFHLKEHMTIPWLIDQRRERDPHSVCIEKKSRFGSYWEPITIQEFHNHTMRIARGLLGLGLGPGDAIAIFSSTSYQWSLLDIAALSMGIISVPMYESDSAEQIQWIAEDAQVRYIFADTAAHLTLAQSAAGSIIDGAFLMDAASLEELENAGGSVPLSRVIQYRSNVSASDLASIIYTSGTTGKPKGVELTHANMVFSTLSVLKAEAPIIDTEHTRVLLFLPLAHIMARIAFLYTIAGHGRVGHVASTHNLISDLASFKPTALLVVPRVLEKVYNAAEAKTGGGKKLKVFRWAAHIAELRSRRRFIGPILATQIVLARHLVWKKMRAILGKDCIYAVSAGAPLGKRLGHVYRGIGLTVVEAFGLTETTGPATVNRVNRVKMGSVGQTLPGTKVRLSNEGEVLITGPHIMRGYHNNPEATAQVIDSDGWFATGDIGTLDKDGFLSITGRKKDLIVTAGGKNVAPAVLEDPLSSHPLISHVVVVGDTRPFVGALITLDSSMLPGWLASHGLPSMSVSEASTHPEVLAALERAIERTNAQVSRAESIRKFRIIPGEFTQENGLLTASMKVRRAQVLQRYASDIEELYIDTRADKRAHGQIR